MQFCKKFTFLIITMVIAAGCQPLTLQQKNNSSILNLTGDSSNLIYPVWSPTSEEILVSSSSYPQLQTAIYKIDIKTKKKKLILETEGRIDAQSWSPDGKKIVFASFGTDKFQEGIWVVDFNGRNPAYIGPGFAASWSPDGGQIAILACEQSIETSDYVASIRIHNIEVGSEKIVYSSDNCKAHFYLVWSPDAKRLAFSYDFNVLPNEPTSQIRILNISSGEVEKTFDMGWSPTWSPNSAMVAFVRSRGTLIDSQIVLYDFGKSCEKTITEMNFPIVGEISWSPSGTKWAVASGGAIYLVDIINLMGEDFLASGLTVCK